ncbi:hypothetical protein HS088_TW02G00302 [Tripterygium wilfordii]|uniref:Uncharacterized protein n=1 Tax=Tripterygium wilfordii TaxID=458696 RepID=A0A7J7DYE1_TRIWF|nr:hypothetical protein HS088_TW02G00302 [Tripterygium wilfordii]
MDIDIPSREHWLVEIPQKEKRKHSGQLPLSRFLEMSSIVVDKADDELVNHNSQTYIHEFPQFSNNNISRAETLQRIESKNTTADEQKQTDYRTRWYKNIR